MERDMLFSGESVNVEYKVDVPKDSAKYMKTVVAYANGRGGKIIFGVDDKTLEVVGMDTDSIFQTIDTITNAISVNVKDVTQNVLISWGVLAEKDGAVVPTNAYALLTGQARFQPVIQCAVFKGKDRAYFVDRREFEGSIQDQMESAFQYVLEKINRGMRIQGMYRQDRYELPVDSVREMIANSVAHRSYLEPGNIQVALFDDRLEVTSPVCC